MKETILIKKENLNETGDTLVIKYKSTNTVLPNIQYIKIILENIAMEEKLKFTVQDQEKLALIFEHTNIVLQNIELLNEEELKPLLDKIQGKNIEKTQEKIKGDPKKGLQKKFKKGLITLSGVTLGVLAGISIGNALTPVKAENTNDPELIVYDTILDKPVNIEGGPIVLSEILISKKELTEEEKMIKKYADMYFIDFDTAKALIKNNVGNLQAYDRPEVAVIECFKEYHWNNPNIDKTPIISDLTEEEKERKILEFANIHGVEDKDVLATIIAVHRVETGRGTSNIYLNYNNCGGNMEYDPETDSQSLIEYKTFEIGAESFIKQFLYVKKTVEQSENYDPNQSLEYNMDPMYCGEIREDGEKWYQIVGELKDEVLKEDILKDFTNSRTL